MQYFDIVGYDKKDPCFDELGILLHGKKGWAKRVEQSKRLDQLLEEAKENIIKRDSAK
ncbi:MAG: hypothetical protein M0R51_11065 [Clostridia bacterium]|jgi:hypothetical protein|nr:hypothetical protein [Clostridia bacterium]